MPRTKVVRKRKLSDSSTTDVTENQTEKKDIGLQIEEVKELINDKIAALNHHHRQEVAKMKRMYNSLKLRAKTSGIGDKKLSEINGIDESEEAPQNSKEPKQQSQRSSRKRSASCGTRSNRKVNIARPISVDRNVHSASKYRTPIHNNIRSMPMVTPKVNPNIPLSVLRRPHPGEFAMSMSGSPLLVSAITFDDMASVSVPLPDGRVLSILPTDGIASARLNFDEETREQLKSLYRNINLCLKG